MQTVPPVVLSCITQSLDSATTTALTHLRTTHDSSKLEVFAKQYVKLLYSTVTGSSASDSLESCGLLRGVQPDRDDLRVVYQDFGPACYIDSSFPVTAHMYLKCVFLSLTSSAAFCCDLWCSLFFFYNQCMKTCCIQSSVHFFFLFIHVTAPIFYKYVCIFSLSTTVILC